MFESLAHEVVRHLRVEMTGDEAEILKSRRGKDRMLSLYDAMPLAPEFQLVEREHFKEVFRTSLNEAHGDKGEKRKREEREAALKRLKISSPPPILLPPKDPAPHSISSGSSSASSPASSPAPHPSASPAPAPAPAPTPTPAGPVRKKKTSSPRRRKRRSDDDSNTLEYGDNSLFVGDDVVLAPDSQKQ